MIVFYLYRVLNDSSKPERWYMQRTHKDIQIDVDNIDVYENTSSVWKMSKWWNMTYEMLLIFNSACGLLIEVSTDLLVEHK